MLSIEEWLYRTFDDVGSYGNPQTDWTIDCTSCDDTKHHLHVSIDKQAVHCFRCGYSNSWLGFVIDQTGLPYHKALSELYKIPRMKDFIDVKKKLDPIVTLSSKPEIHLPQDYKPLYGIKDDYTAYKNYLINRGFDKTYWKKYNLGVSEIVYGRIIVPIEKGYWQGRAIYKWITPKYLNPKNEARDILFNANALQLYDEVVICEGAFSAMAVGDNAVALIGKEAPEEKLQRLAFAEVTHYILALEAGAWETVQRLAEGLFRAGHRVTIWNYTLGDPADKKNKFDIIEYGLKTRMMLGMGYQV